MKRIKLVVAGIELQLIAFGILWLATGVSKAQVSVSVNIGTPPPWGPYGYSEVRYYYLPDVQAYYDVHSSMFIYLGGGGVWIHRSYLPVQYKSYDLYGGYKVVMTGYHGDTPYSNYNEYKTKYVKGYRGSEVQRTIARKPGKGNSGSKGSPDGNQGKGKSKEHGNDKNQNEDHGHGEGNGHKK